ncbi:MAG: alpha/beta hydrolase [Anaerolineales bacterium]|nr:alpha/beta hydrolase [Anaerolineales bacterium]
MTFYTIKGQQIHVKEEGNPHNQLALLIHGWSSSWFAMSPLLPMLKRRFRCIAVDLPGYGQSPPSPEPESMVHYADLMAELIRQVSPKQPAVIVGHSMGGMITLTLTLRHPELVERIILLCPTISGHLSLFMNLFISPGILVERFVAPRISRALQPYLTGLTDQLMRPASLSERGGITQADYERLRTDARNPNQSRVRAQCFWAMREGDLRGQLEPIVDVPSLVIWGMEDNTVPLKDASVLADEWPHLDLRILPRVSHWPQFEAPEITRRYIKAFLGKPLKLIQAVF